MTADLVFLLDVDNPRLDGDRIVRDLHDRIASAFGVAGAQRYWAIFDAIREVQGYVDYLGALQRDPLVIEAASAEVRRLRTISSFLIDYPFADRLDPRALDAIAPLRRIGTTVPLTDGDVVLQPRKLQRSGLWDAVDGRVLIYIHKKNAGRGATPLSRPAGWNSRRQTARACGDEGDLGRAAQHHLPAPRPLRSRRRSARRATAGWLYGRAHRQARRA